MKNFRINISTSLCYASRQTPAQEVGPLLKSFGFLFGASLRFSWGKRGHTLLWKDRKCAPAMSLATLWWTMASAGVHGCRVVTQRVQNLTLSNNNLEEVIDVDFSSGLSPLYHLFPEMGMFIIQEDIPLHLDLAQCTVFVIMGRVKHWA